MQLGALAQRLAEFTVHASHIAPGRTQVQIVVTTLFGPNDRHGEFLVSPMSGWWDLGNERMIRILEHLRPIYLYKIIVSFSLCVCT